MTLHYLDPSAWIKRHFEEAGSDAVGVLFRTMEKAACCRLGLIEMIATVARKSEAESLDRAVTDRLVRTIESDFEAFEVVPVDELLMQAATALAMTHRLRTMDAIHLAAALACRREGWTVVMASSDDELLAAAKREGLAMFDPKDARA